MKLTIFSTGAGVVRLVCEGEITQADFLPQSNPFPTLLGTDCFTGKVLVNLEKTTYIDSAGVGWLVMSNKKFREAGGMLILYSIPPMVNHVFQLLRMPTVLNLAADEAEAMALAGGGKK